MPKGKLLEVLRVVRIRELDRRLGDLTAAPTQHLCHRLAHPLGLLGVAVVHEQNARSRLADAVRGHAHPRLAWTRIAKSAKTLRPFRAESHHPDRMKDAPSCKTAGPSAAL